MNQFTKSRYNRKLDQLIIMGEDIVGFVKGQRLQWLGHMERRHGTFMPMRVVMEAKVY